MRVMLPKGRTVLFMNRGNHWHAAMPQMLFNLFYTPAAAGAFTQPGGGGAIPERTPLRRRGRAASGEAAGGQAYLAGGGGRNDQPPDAGRTLAEGNALAGGGEGRANCDQHNQTAKKRKRGSRGGGGRGGGQKAGENEHAEEDERERAGLAAGGGQLDAVAVVKLLENILPRKMDVKEGRSWLVQKHDEGTVQFGTKRTSGTTVWADNHVNLKQDAPRDWRTSTQYQVVAVGHTEAKGDMLALVREGADLWALNVTPVVEQDPGQHLMAPVKGSAMDRFFKSGGGYSAMADTTAAAKKILVRQAREDNHERDTLYRTLGQWAETKPRLELKAARNTMWVTVSSTGLVGRPGQAHEYTFAWTRYGLPHEPPPRCDAPVQVRRVRAEEWAYPPVDHLTFRVQPAGRPIMESLPVIGLPTA